MPAATTDANVMISTTKAMAMPISSLALIPVAVWE
jgi:hypothetical protein